MVQREINRGRHTDHPAGRHSIRTNQFPNSTIPPYFLRAGCPSCRPTNSVKALKATSSYGFLSGTAEKSSGVKFYMHVRLLTGMSFSHFGELARGESRWQHFPGCMRPLKGCRRWLPAKLDGDSELGAVARCWCPCTPLGVPDL